jgi:hypothetical protein
MSTCVLGLGSVRPPPSTHTLPPYATALVSPVARGVEAIATMVSAVGSYLYDRALSTSVVPFQADPPIV